MMQLKNFFTVLALFSSGSATEAADEGCSAASANSDPIKSAALFQTPPIMKSDAAESVGVTVVQLQRAEQRSFDGHPAPADGHPLYIGNLTIGYPPQILQVMFDTGSSYTVLPHRACRSKACKEHIRYSSWQSQTALDIDLNGERVDKRQRIVMGAVNRDSASFDYETADFGSGSARGVVVRDSVCFRGKNGNKSCAKPGIVAALYMDDVPFRAMPNDGIVGLGLQVACGRGKSVCSLLDNMVQRNPAMKRQFGLAFGARGGELHIGGFHPAALGGPIEWFPVHSPEEGLWQVEIKAVKVGDIVLNSCEKGCHAVIDSSSHSLGVTASELRRTVAALTGVVTDGHCQAPELIFELNGMTVTLKPEDYMDSSCKPDLGPLRFDDMVPVHAGEEIVAAGSAVSTIYAFGQMVLRHYFVAFDWSTNHVGFAPTAFREEITV